MLEGNTNFVLGLPRAKQVGLEHGKKKLEGVATLISDPPPTSFTTFSIFSSSLMFSFLFMTFDT